MAKKRKFSRLAMGLLAALLLLVAAGCGDGNASAQATQTASGVSYLQSLEQKPPSAVEDQLKAIRRAEIQAMHDQRLRQLESGEVSVWSLFQDYVLLGDSRSCGFFFSNYLDESRVMAAYGATIRSIEEHIPEMQQLNPSYIFLCYGLNDMVQEGWETPELYTAAYAGIIRSLQQTFPDAKIYINSIFPVRDPAFERWDKWHESQDYSDAVEQMCRETGCYFIANENIDDSMAHLWQEDGIHFVSEFYPIWATNMIMEVYDSEIEISEDPAA